MSILIILFLVGVVNIVSPAFGDINPGVKYYNPVAAVLKRTFSGDTTCPGALVWVKHWQVFLQSSTCRIVHQDEWQLSVRVGGNADANTNGKEMLRPLSSRTYDGTEPPFIVRLIFFKGEPFPLTPLFMPGILQKEKSEDENDLPVTISRDTWGPHHEVRPIMDMGGGNNFTLNFTEPLTSERKCPEDVRWGPAIRPSRWSVPMIIGVFIKYNDRSEDKGVCKVSLRYTSIIPAVQWIEEKVTRYYEGLHQFLNDKKSEADYITYLNKTYMETKVSNGNGQE